MVDVPERLNPLLKPAALKAADEAACRLDGMFRDILNQEDRMDLIVTIIRTATTVALGLPLPPGATPAPPPTTCPICAKRAVYPCLSTAEAKTCDLGPPPRVPV